MTCEKFLRLTPEQLADECASAARAFRLSACQSVELDNLFARHNGRPVFASAVIVEAVRRERSARGAA